MFLFCYQWNLFIFWVICKTRLSPFSVSLSRVIHLLLDVSINMRLIAIFITDRKNQKHEATYNSCKCWFIHSRFKLFSKIEIKAAIAQSSWFCRKFSIKFNEYVGCSIFVSLLIFSCPAVVIDKEDKPYANI